MSFEFSPMDQYNQELVSNVLPGDWKNPAPIEKYDMVVIGGGTAGLVTSSAAAGLGAKVALIERQHMGGDCLNTGCVPSKALIHAAKEAYAKYLADSNFDRKAIFGEVMTKLRAKRTAISPNDSAKRFSELGVDVFIGDGTFKGKGVIEVGNQTLHYRKAVIATGARAAEIPIPGLAETPHRTNESIFNLEILPEKLVVIGGGPIGVELAQSFNRLGSEVHLIEVGNHILSRENPEAAEILQKRLIQEGVVLHLNAKIEKISSSESGQITHLILDGKAVELPSNELLVAVGRAPNVEGLGLENIGVEYDLRKGVKVNDRLKTTGKNVWACGDICSATKFTHTADFQARIVIQNALFFGRKKNSDLVVPWVTYSEPEIAHVGAYAHDLKASNEEYLTFRLGFDDVDRSILEEETDGFCEVLTNKKGTILGATMVHSHAGDMISELTLAMSKGVSLGSLASVIHPYPTQAEIIRKLGDQYNRTRLTAGVKKILGFLLKLS